MRGHIETPQPQQRTRHDLGKSERYLLFWEYLVVRIQGDERGRDNDTPI